MSADNRNAKDLFDGAPPVGAEDSAALKALVSQTHALMYVLDLEDRYLYANKATADFVGTEPEEMVGRPKSDFFPKALTEDFRTNALLVLAKRKPMVFQELAVHKGQQKIFNSLKFPLFDEDGNAVGTGGISIDVDDWVQSQRNQDFERSVTFHATKLAWLGEMAGGVAHEINNPLAVIHGYANRLREEATGGVLNPEKVARTAEKIESMVLRIHKIVTSLREMADDSETAPFQTCSLKTLVENTVCLLQPRLDEHGVIQIDPIPDELQIDCRGPQISQILMHLIMNARAAIRSANQKWIRITCEPNEDLVEIRVIDSGEGVPTQLKDRIFDPFFSTGSPNARSTGLGLTIARRLCEMHDGALILDLSAPHTTFVVRLPLRQYSRANPRPPKA